MTNTAKKLHGSWWKGALLLFFFALFFTACKEKKVFTPPFKQEKDLYAVMIVQDNKEVFREFYNGKSDTDLFNIQSEAKSIMAILTGIAIEKGFIKGADQPIADFFPQLLTDKDSAKRAITIQQLLNQTSGLKDFEYPQLDEWLASAHPSDLILAQPLVTAPGTVYQYNTAATHLLSVIIARATHMETANFARKHLFKPLHIEKYDWGKLNDGYHDGGGLSLRMRTADMARIGELLLNGGKFENNQIVSKQWVSALFNTGNKLKAPWGLKNSLHGNCWYSVVYKGQKLNYAMGYGGQFLFLFPGLKAVVAVNYNHDTPSGIENTGKFFEKYLPLIFEKLNAG